MKKITAYGKIENGELIYFEERLYRQELLDVGTVNHFKQTIEYGNKRTIDQNSYLWGGIVKPIWMKMVDYGYDYTKSEVYHYLERRFCKEKRVNEKTGETYTGIIEFKTMSTEQFEYHVFNKIIPWATESLEIYIKLPHEFYKMTLMAYDEWKRGNITKSKAVEMSKDKLEQQKAVENFYK